MLLRLNLRAGVADQGGGEYLFAKDFSKIKKRCVLNRAHGLVGPLLRGAGAFPALSH